VIDVQDNVLCFFAIDRVLVSFVTIATTGAIFSLKFTKNRLAAGLHPDPLGELERSPRTPSHKTGGLLLREGKGGKEIEWQGWGENGRGGERRGQERSGGEGKEGERREGGKGEGKERRGRWKKRGKPPPNANSGIRP